ncbi:hypothetical protein [Vibrio owensii]|uniref:hypothetical protein n=1 Tax=Vibrio owensii TaxID=696485 RepID=UPI0018F177BE|nr:hypothetical protein [Vibrio owensii]
MNTVLIASNLSQPAATSIINNHLGNMNVISTPSVSNNEMVCLSVSTEVPTTLANHLWAQLSEVPCSNDEIEEAFLHFTPGTSNYDIWHWFESTFSLSVTSLCHNTSDGLAPHTFTNSLHLLTKAEKLVEALKSHSKATALNLTKEQNRQILNTFFEAYKSEEMKNIASPFFDALKHAPIEISGLSEVYGSNTAGHDVHKVSIKIGEFSICFITTTFQDVDCWITQIESVKVDGGDKELNEALNLHLDGLHDELLHIAFSEGEIELSDTDGSALTAKELKNISQALAAL